MHFIWKLALLVAFEEKNILKVVCGDFSPDSYRSSENGLMVEVTTSRLAERPISKGETHEAGDEP